MYHHDLSLLTLACDSFQGVLRFFKEGSPDPIGMLAGVQGFVSCAVQFTTLDDEIELMPF